MFDVDVAVVGAGVMGCALARELARYDVDVVVLERAHDVGEGSSKANSGIVHAGFQPRGGTLKGRSCVQGNALFGPLADELEIPFVRCGALMVAFSAKGVEKLQQKAGHAAENGAGNLPIVSGEEARSLEPRLSPRVTHALLAPATGIVSPFELVLALAQNACANGVEFLFDAHVEHVERTDAGQSGGVRWLLHMADGRRVSARFVANMAGEEATLIDAQVHPADLVVRPRVGDYLVFDKQDPANAITHVIYQAADADEGGTLLAPTTEGNLLAGPTSRNVRVDQSTATTVQGLDHVRRVARKVVPDIDFGQVISSFAGARTNIVNVAKEQKDFVVRASAPGFVSALGIKNPGLTCSPALARLAVRVLADEGMPLRENTAFDPRRRRWIPVLKRSAEDQEHMLAEDARYGRVVCRCEQVTEGDVRAIMRGSLPPATVDGVKHRLRIGMGRCQGAFCLPRVVSIMADEFGVPESSVAYGERGGRLVMREVK